jgi:hypothetical protein
MITVVTEMEIGIVAVAIGYIVGQAVRVAGNGIDKKFGYLGAVCALFGCILGNILSAIAIFARAKGVAFGDLLATLDFDFIRKLMVAFFHPLDLLFYAIALYEGYRFSIKYRLVGNSVPK